MPTPRRHATVIATGFVLAAALLSGCGSDDEPASAPTTTATSAATSAPAADNGQAQTFVVEVDDMTFSPADLTISVGDTVTWKFSDDVVHGVQGIGDKAMGINSPLFTEGEWSHTFTTAGSFRYLCPIHPEMRGTITVQ
ncbi:plastocyanin/azurin family copper-binding protein [Nocardia cyriacigeorgica]|uniref:plastocyanin/azurin family copper-binding protein n=1 Tax=Nocardia cyriacigeorgica TaxID=135487 RepID=UPI0021140EBC|nr:plastocyanin/azurin family copper-binding protein [Nocardia cyriacigeorgica]